MTKINISLSLDESLVARVDAIAAREGVRRSWIVNRVVSGWISECYEAQAIEPPVAASKPSGVGRHPKLRTPVEDLEVSL